MTQTLLTICFFTFLIHMTESMAYSMRLAGVRAKRIAIAMAFVTSTLLVSRMSNMFQAPLLGAMVDFAILSGTRESLSALESQFRVVIFAASTGAFMGAFLTPTAVQLFKKAIERFSIHGSVPLVVLSAAKPSNLFKIIKTFKFPSPKALSTLSLKGVSKKFLIINVFVTALYSVGVLCSLLAGAYLPEFRSTALQLSGIVNGMATIMFTLLVDPPGARVTDAAVNGSGEITENSVRSVVFFMQAGKIIGTLVVAQILFKPLSLYIMTVAKWLTSILS